MADTLNNTKVWQSAFSPAKKAELVKLQEQRSLQATMYAIEQGASPEQIHELAAICRSHRRQGICPPQGCVIRSALNG